MADAGAKQNFCDSTIAVLLGKVKYSMGKCNFNATCLRGLSEKTFSDTMILQS